MSAGTSAPSAGASGPVGFGAWKVPFDAQYSCHLASMSLASVAV